MAANSLGSGKLAAPVSLWHGWLNFIFWLNLFAIFTSVQDPAHPDWIHVLLVFLVLFQLAGTAIAYTEYKSVHGDVPGAFVIAWLVTKG